MRRSIFARIRLARELLREFEADEAVSEQFDYAGAIDRLLASGFAQRGIQTTGQARWREAAKKAAQKREDTSTTGERTA